jgi:hypothetical protein
MGEIPGLKWLGVSFWQNQLANGHFQWPRTTTKVKSLVMNKNAPLRVYLPGYIIIKHKTNQLVTDYFETLNNH